MASHQCDMHGCFHASTVPSTSTNLPGCCPDIQAIHSVAESASNSEVKGVLAETSPHNLTSIIDPDSPTQQAPDPAAQASLTISNPSTQQRQTLLHFPFLPASPHSLPVTSTSQPTNSNPVPPIPPFVLPPPPVGIDMNLWVHNQAFMAALIPMLILLLQALQLPLPLPPPPAPIYIPPPAPVYVPPPLLPKEGDSKALTIFNGTDHTKLRDFLFECNLVFTVKPCTFVTDKAKIMYAIQYLDGTTKHHFCQYIETSSANLKVNVWTDFALKLHTIFGNLDRTKWASTKLLSLKMKDNTHVHKYMVQ